MPKENRLRLRLGFHHDLHASEKDRGLGSKVDVRALARQFGRLAVDWVQTDCKGHPGLTSWPSKLPDASICPGLGSDLLGAWSRAAALAGLPLVAHYSGVYDSAAIARHPEWGVQPPEEPQERPGIKDNEATCVRSDYSVKLLIPQILEAAKRYGLAGVWVDGEVWGMKPCYCVRCREEFRRRTGWEAPVEPADPRWPAWWKFLRDSFYEYVANFSREIRRELPEFNVISNWFGSFSMPGPLPAEITRISGDAPSTLAFDVLRQEVRFVSTRGRPWDVMHWTFLLGSHTQKPESVILQEAAITAAYGGDIQLYHQPENRDGRLPEWQIDRIASVYRKLKKYLAICQGSSLFPSVGLLHSEYQLAETTRARNLLVDLDLKAVKGGVYLLADRQIPFDILDEWAAIPRLDELPLLVVPEAAKLSQEMVHAIRTYVHNGGTLLLTGTGGPDVFGTAFLGASLRRRPGRVRMFVWDDVSEGAPVDMEECVILKPARSSQTFGEVAVGPMREKTTPAWCVTLHGRGRVVYSPYAWFRSYFQSRNLETGRALAAVIHKVCPHLPVRVEGAEGVEVIVRKDRRARLAVHLINLRAGATLSLERPLADKVPDVGAIKLSLASALGVKKLSLFSRKHTVSGRRRGSRIEFEIPFAGIHEILTTK